MSTAAAFTHPLHPTPMPPLEGDLFAAPTNPALSVFLTEIQEVHAHDAVNVDLPVHAGTLVLHVLEVLHATDPVNGGTLQVPFHQIIDPLVRLRNEADTWNALDLTRGKLLLMVCSTPDHGHTWKPYAALTVSGPKDNNVETLRHAYRAHADSGLGRNLDFMSALESNNPALFSYAVDALAHRNLLNHEDATHLLVTAFQRKENSSQKQRELGSALTDFFHAPGQDTPQQQQILAALATALVTASDPERRANWAFSLRSCILAADGAEDPHIAGLIRSIEQPPAQQILQTLAAVEQDTATTPSPNDRATIIELRDVWQKATT